MTTAELKKHFYEKFGFSSSWPQTYEVSATTYANICHSVFERMATPGIPSFIHVAVGPHGGIMFQSVELILKVRSNVKESSESSSQV